MRYPEEFKRGERVRIYSDKGIFTGVVRDIGNMFVFVDAPGTKEIAGTDGFYPQQLRRLKPAKEKS